MKFSKVLLASAAALALVSCGKKDAGADTPKSETSQQADKAEAGSPLDQQFSLKGAEPVDIDALFALMPEDERPSYETSSFDKKLGATVIQNLRFADANDGEAVVIARAEFYGVDMEAIERVRGAENAGHDAPFETVFEKVRFIDVTSVGHEDEDEAAKLSIGGVELDKLQIRQGGVDGDGEGDKGARFINAVNLAGLYFKDISMATETEDAPSLAFSAPDLRFVGLGGGRVGAVIANELSYDMTQSAASLSAMRAAMGPQGAAFLSGPLAGILAPESQRVSMKRLEWRDIDFSGLLAWGLKDEKPPVTEKNLINLGTMKAAEMETHVNGKLAATVKEANLSAGEFIWMIPSNFKADSKGVVYDFTAYAPEADENVLKVLKEHGLDMVKGDGAMSWVWNEKSGGADFSYVANLDKVAKFNTSLAFSNLKLEEIASAMDEGESDAVFSKGAFKDFSLKIEDEKALDAIFSLAALQMGGTGKDLRMSVPAMIRLSGAQAAQMNPRISDYVSALADFVAKGGSLEVAANPAEPVSFTSLQASGMTAPQTMPDVINLTVTHKE